MFCKPLKKNAIFNSPGLPRSMRANETRTCIVQFESHFVLTSSIFDVIKDHTLKYMLSYMRT